MNWKLSSISLLLFLSFYYSVESAPAVRQMSTEEVSTLANSALPYVEACFKKHKKNRGKKLTTKISLGLDRTGRVTAFSEKSSTKKLDTFVLCLNQKLNSANLAVPSDSASGVFDINITLQ